MSQLQSYAISMNNKLCQNSKYNIKIIMVNVILLKWHHVYVILQ